ncbi:glycosyltransferase family 2 protein [Klebsiella michiganensis]|uniref:glycosyltransferase family 2 protein n=2 Tax=Klebsiella michiganensis TaxID=1134687 RepID=UPI00391BEB87
MIQLKEYDNVILIVLYNKKPLECRTILSLLKNKPLVNSKVIIWNNGPDEINIADSQEKIESHGYEFAFFETTQNASLAYIYNQAITIFQSLRYILLDHDSNLSGEYLTDVSLIFPDNIGMPEIYVNGELVNPCINMLPCQDFQNRLPDVPVMTIGSGLVIGKNIIEKLTNIYGRVFDERFYLYGVDTTFCLRVFNAGMTRSIICIHGFEHSLSRLEIEHGLIKEFRRIERSCDLALRIRYYIPVKKWYKEVPRVYLSFLKKIILCSGQQYKITVFSKVFFRGKHLRDMNIS